MSIAVTPMTTLYGRLRGLIGRPAPDPGAGVLLCPCRQVHTFFMSYAIDVLHLDGGGRVLDVQTLPPWRIGRWHRRTEAVLELRAGEAERLKIGVGHTVGLIEAGTRATTRS